MVGVDRLQPGDHAFLSFADDKQRWDILSAFTHYGLARGEKILLSVDTARPLDEVAAQLAGGETAAREVLSSGQLVVSAAPGFPPGTSDATRFDATRFADASRKRIDDAAAEGFSGVRTASELSLALMPFDGMGQLVDFERNVHRELTGSGTSVRYTALCQWDERRFGDGPHLDAVRSIHPVTVLPTPGALYAACTDDGVRLTGDSDLSSREELTAALRALEDLRQRPDQSLVLDLTDLSFMDAHSTGTILRLAASLSPPRRLEVRCRAHHRRMFHVLGGRAIRQLAIITERVP
jgi:hypothetical protein